MRIILGYQGGSSYYPYVQKSVDYQPYRPVYLFRGPPPDAGFSYGLFEDIESGKKYYAEQGLEPFSPFSGKPAKMLEVVTHEELKALLGDDSKELEEVNCPFCSAAYHQNLHVGDTKRELYCHRCGGRLPLGFFERQEAVEEKGKKEAAEGRAKPLNSCLRNLWSITPT